MHSSSLILMSLGWLVYGEGPRVYVEPEWSRDELGMIRDHTGMNRDGFVMCGCSCCLERPLLLPGAPAAAHVHVCGLKS
jgi:hypothetical protein